MKHWQIITITTGALLLMSSRKPLNVRNNNPLNIRFSESNNWLGQVGSSGGFVKFQSPEHGFRAAYKLISRYINDYGLTSISQVINRWAPPEDDNHTAAYIDYLADKLGKWTFTPIADDEVPSLLYYMAKFEGAKNAFSFDQVMRGVSMA